MEWGRILKSVPVGVLGPSHPVPRPVPHLVLFALVHLRDFELARSAEAYPLRRSRAGHLPVSLNHAGLS